MKQRKMTIRKTVWRFVVMFFVLAAISQGATNVVYAAEEIFVIGEEVDCITDEDIRAIGISYGSASDHQISLKSGNYVKWIDRLNIPDYAKKLYDKLVEAADNDGNSDFLIDGSVSKLKVTSFTCSKKQLDKVLDDVADVIYITTYAFKQDHPEVFWLNNWTQTYYQYEDLGNSYRVTYYLVIKDTLKGEKYDMRASGYQSSSKVKDAIKERNQVVSNIISKIPKNANTVETLRYFNEYLVLNNQYCTGDTDQRSVHRSITALKGATGESGPVCEGYAKAFKVLCDKVGIPCVIVDGANHEWNYVKVDDKWYAVDVTWNDPVIEGSKGAVSGSENEKWFLVGSETIPQNYSEKFIESHPNECRTNVGVKANNGPKLNKTAYHVSGIDKVETNAKEFFYGDSITPTVTVTTKKLAKGRVTYQWYKSDGTKLEDYTTKILWLYPRQMVDTKAGNYYCEISYNGVVEKKVDVVVKPRVITPKVYGLLQKTYDGSKELQVDSKSVLFEGAFYGMDDVYFDTTNLICTFEDANVGNDKNLQISNLALAGEDASNYVLSTKYITYKGRIEPLNIREEKDDVQVVLKNDEFVYNGNPQTIEVVKVLINGEELSDITYVLKNETQKDAGKYIANLDLGGNYKGTVSCSYEILPFKVENMDVQVILEDTVLEFYGIPQSAKVSKVLIDGEEISVDCYVSQGSKQFKAGRYTETLSFIKNYDGVVQYEYEIVYTQKMMKILYTGAAIFGSICVLFIFLKIKKRKIKK